jgi:cytochrome c oxidase cbb3-type subunit I/II
LDDAIDTATTGARIRAMQTLGVPYEKGYDQIANRELMAQAEKISKNLKADKIETSANREIVALIAYLQRIGVDIKGEQPLAAKQ